MKKNFSETEVVSGGTVLRLIAELARVHHKNMNLDSLNLVSAGFEELTINQLREGIMYCYDKGLVLRADDGSIYLNPCVTSLLEAEKLLEAVGFALENICIRCDGLLKYEDFMKDDNEELLYAAFVYDLPEESVSVIRELLLEWHLVRLDGIGNIIVE